MEYPVHVSPVVNLSLWKLLNVSDVACSVLQVWLFLWLMNRYNPYEYGERRRRKLASDEEASLFSVSGSFWYTFTILQWQGKLTGTAFRLVTLNYRQLQACTQRFNM
jgi:hypothetical protein